MKPKGLSNALENPSLIRVVLPVPGGPDNAKITPELLDLLFFVLCNLEVPS